MQKLQRSVYILSGYAAVHNTIVIQQKNALTAFANHVERLSASVVPNQRSPLSDLTIPSGITDPHPTTPHLYAITSIDHKMNFSDLPLARRFRKKEQTRKVPKNIIFRQKGSKHVSPEWEVGSENASFSLRVQWTEIKFPTQNLFKKSYMRCDSPKLPTWCPSQPDLFSKVILEISKKFHNFQEISKKNSQRR